MTRARVAVGESDPTFLIENAPLNPNGASNERPLAAKAEMFMQKNGVTAYETDSHMTTVMTAVDTSDHLRSPAEAATAEATSAALEKTVHSHLYRNDLSARTFAIKSAAAQSSDEKLAAAVTSLSTAQPSTMIAIARLPPSAPNSTAHKSHKTDAPILNYIFDSHLATSKHHHHDRYIFRLAFVNGFVSDFALVNSPFSAARCLSVSLRT